ncbi:MAG TPA: lipocalin family protein [Casimicrobium huifangae]|uniref:lipocalin family protein n=1 Tax=Casimicrobium huifangae TaxID=2591109 RepID=UPI001396790D|nr:lipocalin family protein [Casimicrobium huifangae]HOB03538.1 lipocalin family protein [Casimicrobium huifangae]HQD66824.1 lipocalin family protein [Casimicrobium huifangae]
MSAGFFASASAQDLARSVVGSWRLVSHTVTTAGTTFDSHSALLQQRPCAAKIRYNIGADGTYRLDASASDCDEKYKSAQQKLYAKTKWKLDGNKITTSSTNFAVGQTYSASISGSRMTWIGTEGQGTLVFER